MGNCLSSSKTTDDKPTQPYGIPDWRPPAHQPAQLPAGQFQNGRTPPFTPPDRRPPPLVGIGQQQPYPNYGPPPISPVSPSSRPITPAVTTPPQGTTRYVAALDFGTTFSGFAFAARNAPNNVFVFQDWPGQTEGLGRPYCKTTTSLLYERMPDGSLEMRQWGWPARIAYLNQLQVERREQRMHAARGSERPPQRFLLVERFKLYLAEVANSELPAVALPEGLEPRRVIADYIRAIGSFALERARIRFGAVEQRDIQWCLTVPAMWSDRAKQEMKKIAVEAGLVEEDSEHPVLIVLEPEAASIFSQQKLLTEQNVDIARGGQEFLVCDAGGGTVDLVLHQMDHTGRLKERAAAKGDLCGGTYVDNAFVQFLCKEFRCFRDFMMENPYEVLELRKQFELLKCSFGGGITSNFRIPLPRKLADLIVEDDDTIEDPDSLWMDESNLKPIFDPTVNKILALVEAQLEKVPSCKEILVVGGFAGSAYLVQMIRERFAGKLGGPQKVVSPGEPGGAVVQGAVMFALKPDAFSSRISRKTYGIRSTRAWRPEDPPEYRMDDGSEMGRCVNIFQVYVRAGDEIKVDDKIVRRFAPMNTEQEAIDFVLVSSLFRDPMYTTDPGAKVESKCTVNLRRGGHEVMKHYDVAMYFGRTTVEVTATPVDPQAGERGAIMDVQFDTGDDI